MTCGESRSVCTVINALCNSLKPIKRSRRFSVFCILLCLPQQENAIPTVHARYVFSLLRGFLDSCRYIWPTVHTTWETLGEIYAWNIIVSGGSGAAASNLAATNSNLSANISLLLTSVRRIVIGDIPSSKKPSLLHRLPFLMLIFFSFFFIINFFVGCFVFPDDISQLLI